MERLISQPTTVATPSTLCGRCGRLVASLPLLGMEIPVPYCADCATLLAVEAEAAEERREADLRFERAGATKRLRSFSWEAAARAEAGRLWLRRYASGERQNLILNGAVGTGKTGLAWLIIADLCEQGIPALFLNFRDLLWDVKRSFNSPDSASLLALRAQSVRVLALDDLGAERPTAWACEELATLVDRRYEKMLPTIVTSNYAPSEMADRLGREEPVVGGRIVSRLIEGATMVKFEGSDRRLTA